MSRIIDSEWRAPRIDEWGFLPWLRVVELDIELQALIGGFGPELKQRLSPRKLSTAKDFARRLREAIEIDLERSERILAAFGESCELDYAEQQQQKRALTAIDLLLSLDGRAVFGSEIDSESLSDALTQLAIPNAARRACFLVGIARGATHPDGSGALVPVESKALEIPEIDELLAMLSRHFRRSVLKRTPVLVRAEGLRLSAVRAWELTNWILEGASFSGTGEVRRSSDLATQKRWITSIDRLRQSLRQSKALGSSRIVVETQDFAERFEEIRSLAPPEIRELRSFLERGGEARWRGTFDASLVLTL